ncbi:NUDIX hydrolase [Marisediminicola sp. LYQ134]|uniref:NUDIX hydrolase n=1 Tax=unclassified Marisediminicola TaxID=2618316 RepID=UPI0039836F29
MSAADAPLDARAELRAVLERDASRATEFAGLSDAPVADGSRAAAVLILFGVLDSLPSDRRARDRAVSRDLDVLLLARASTLRAHPGQVAFPGGRIDPGDAGPVDAALREAREETGLDPDGVDVLGTLSTVPLAFSNHLVTPVLAWWSHPAPVRAVDERESAAVFRAPVADLLDPAHRGVTVVRRFGTERRDPGFLVDDAAGGTGEHLVWGFTAMLLDGIFDRLGWTEPWDASRELPLDLPATDG